MIGLRGTANATVRLGPRLQRRLASCIVWEGRKTRRLRQVLSPISSAVVSLPLRHPAPQLEQARRTPPKQRSTFSRREVPSINSPTIDRSLGSQPVVIVMGW